MAKINREEYRVLKNLDDKWKWIARDSGGNRVGNLFAYSEKPFKQDVGVWDYGGGVLPIDNHLFRFIQWEDEEPHNIAELIEEHEKDYKGSWKHAIEFSKEIRRESEETEVKSKQELIEKWESAIESAEFYGKGKEKELISYMKDFVSDLNQLVPKQEEVDRAYKDGYEKGKQHTFYKGYLEGLADKEPIDPERIPEVDQHKELLDELNDLYARKNQDYGNSFDKSLDEDGLLVLKIRLGDKFKRFSQLINNEQMVNDESMRDTLIDLANYALMGVMWMDKNGEEE